MAFISKFEGSWILVATFNWKVFIVIYCSPCRKSYVRLCIEFKHM